MIWRSIRRFIFWSALARWPGDGPGMARGMNRDTPGVVVPETIIRRLDGAPVRKRRDEGWRIWVEQIEQLKERPGISGIDIMDLDLGRYGEVIEAAGLSERPIAAV